jgi:hypothetical protein
LPSYKDKHSALKEKRQLENVPMGVADDKHTISIDSYPGRSSRTWFNSSIMFLRSLSASLVLVGVVVAAINFRVQDDSSVFEPVHSTQTEVNGVGFIFRSTVPR